MAIENVTEFNDTVFDTFLDQRHERLKVKGSKSQDSSLDTMKEII